MSVNPVNAVIATIVAMLVGVVVFISRHMKD